MAIAICGRLQRRLTLSLFWLFVRFVGDQPRRPDDYVDLGPARRNVDYIRDHKRKQVIDRSRVIDKAAEHYVNNVTGIVNTKAEKRHTSLEIGTDWTHKRAVEHSENMEK